METWMRRNSKFMKKTLEGHWIFDEYRREIRKVLIIRVSFHSDQRL
jgi:hypothetical protein